MRAVTGSVVSSKPISLSKADSLLARFISSESVARQDVSAYLKRASNVFEELVQFHREIKVIRRRFVRESEDVGDGNEDPAKEERNPRGELHREIRENGEEERRKKVGLGGAGDGNLIEEERNEKKKMKRKKDGEEEVEKRNLGREKSKKKREEEEVGMDLDEGTEMKRKKRKHFYAEEEARGFDDRIEQRKKKKRKKEME